MQRGGNDMRDTLLRLENECLKIVVYANAAVDLLDKQTGEGWQMGPVALQEVEAIEHGHVWPRTDRSLCEEIPGRFSGVLDGQTVRYTMTGLLNEEIGQFSVHYRLDGRWFIVEIPAIDDSIPILTFPTPIVCDSLVLPINQGRWIRKPLTGRNFWRFPGTLNMRWFGGLRGDTGWMAIVADVYADAGTLATEMAISPVWQQSLDAWRGTRAVHYTFTSNGYVGMAKTFRRWAQQHNLYKTLDEKICERPALKNLLGGRSISIMQAMPFQRARFEDRLMPIPARYAGTDEGVVSFFTHAETKALIEEAKALGMTRGMFTLHGWVRGGYDEVHPDIWPPEPALGSVNELRALCMEDDPYLVSLHDNYQDIYAQSPSFPHGTCRLRDNSPMKGGIWAGGQAYILDSSASLAYAQRNWPLLATLQPRAMYVDTVTAEQFKESFAPYETQTRAQDEERKIALLRFFREQGIILASESGADFGIPYIDWAPVPHSRTPGESIPLWSLVYHECLINIRGTFAWQHFDAPLLHRTCLENMLWGYMLTIGFADRDCWREIKNFWANTTMVDEWFGRIGTAEMVDHRFLSEDGQLEQTEYANGAAIAVNFADESRDVDGVTVPPQGYLVRA